MARASAGMISARPARPQCLFIAYVCVYLFENLDNKGVRAGHGTERIAGCLLETIS